MTAVFSRPLIDRKSSAGLQEDLPQLPVFGWTKMTTCDTPHRATNKNGEGLEHQTNSKHVWECRPDSLRRSLYVRVVLPFLKLPTTDELMKQHTRHGTRREQVDTSLAHSLKKRTGRLTFHAASENRPSDGVTPLLDESHLGRRGTLHSVSSGKQRQGTFPGRVQRGGHDTAVPVCTPGVTWSVAFGVDRGAAKKFCFRISGTCYSPGH